MRKNNLTIIVPCYNEEEVLHLTNRSLSECLMSMVNEGLVSQDSSILYVDDGSHDATWSLIKKYKEKHPHICGLKLSRNYGHQTALIAGLTKSTSDITVSIDADLQDDVNCIREMVLKYHQGCDVVYAARDDRNSDSLFKRTSAELYYKIMAKMGVEQIHNHADFRLLSKRAVSSLLQFKESEIYLRGIIPQIGYKSEVIYYKRLQRTAGESKYPFSKMLSLAIKGITSNTIFPLRAISITGFIISFISFIAFIGILLEKFLGTTFPGWASITAGIFFLGGVQLFSLGVIGEYVGKIYMESKRRPRYFTDEDI